jgi:Membrane bound FAD containing D-sorbitol dehydrogenase
MLDDFLALSAILTGVEELDAGLGRRYLDRISSTPFAPSLREILRRFNALEPGQTRADKVRQEIISNDELRPAIIQIVLLWYTSAMHDNDGMPANLRYGTQDEYFSGLGWRILGAHAPGLSGGYFGHWRYRPENEPRTEGQ